MRPPSADRTFEAAAYSSILHLPSPSVANLLLLVRWPICRYTVLGYSAINELECPGCGSGQRCRHAHFTAPGRGEDKHFAQPCVFSQGDHFTTVWARPHRVLQSATDWALFGHLNKISEMQYRHQLCVCAASRFGLTLVARLCEFQTRLSRDSRDTKQRCSLIISKTFSS